MADVARALDYRSNLFLTGFEALEKRDPEGGFVPDNLYVRDSLEEQVSVVVDKITTSLQPLGADVGSIRRLTLYLRDDQDPERARSLVDDALAKRASEGRTPNVDYFIHRGHGMVMDDFKIEIDGLAVHDGANEQQFVTLSCTDSDPQAVAAELAERLPADSGSRGLNVVAKSTSGLADDWLAAFATHLEQAAGLNASESVSLASLHVAALCHPSATVELDASTFIL